MNIYLIIIIGILVTTPKGVSIKNSNFTDNISKTNSGIHISKVEEKVEIIGCIFENNHIEDGGSIYLSEGTELEIKDC